MQKHAFYIEYTLSKSINKDGTITTTKTQRITYGQDWRNYTKAQEVRLFKMLLKDLVENVPEPVRKVLVVPECHYKKLFIVP